MRLDKCLADCGLGTRSEVKSLLKAKRITVNGKVVTNGKVQVNPETDVILFDGEKIQYEEFVYIMMNKPKGVVSATEDNLHKTVLDLIDPLYFKKGVFPVGRLDIDTHGLLLLTNDGELAHRLLSPKKHVTKIYHARVEGVMTPEDAAAFERGIVLSDGTECMPARLDILSTTQDESVVQIHLKEGKFHQVKRMVKACGKTVVDLERLTMVPLKLDERLALGESRPLTEEELQLLMNNE
ncbi:Ribosomal small subunit pseudouridine synthase A [Granulicatella adiacens]|uniref:pseudouridine synthase n=1 Tax=Granulicatella adiacens TaxID=46124 RepID=UPI00195DBF3E|nr:pseudouridine synthase [Granulicatella adiacens]VTX73592.1 Ribosomal small subunit pseudouridine synthase A [Granulicatella adiacens]